ncbi:hypothetical protein CERZMDRAFT_81111 [Cercospora zeae-maydis SCOH1-5]|uniref:Uncharacterized protein n=1 Tax=Cercospora zeae-maydis SCOH1-5 TaxID=717836 RepID=A0A6A6FUP2_9PEZI|nr:hypothetical protein CERZMDRAFT_81111 [Cercospora zeae-maydis SCOH1-5]
MADEALTCFTSLLDNVPGWIAELESILQSAKDTQQEILCATRTVTDANLPSRNDCKSPSLKSTKSRDRHGRLRPILNHLTASDALRLSQRKRKTASVASGDGSGPCKFRVRAQVVVHYDGNTQRRFEQLVRQISSSRNAIRKGKMSAKVDALSRSGSSSSDSSCLTGGEDMDHSAILTDFKYQPTTRSRLPAFGRNDGTEAFDKVDGRLEKAQALCERAAHQILRDGDCTVELQQAREHFSEALTMATEELPALQKKAEKAAERRRRSEERHRLDEEAEATLRALKPDHALNNNNNNKLHDIVADISVPSDGDLEVDVLEVDDDSSSDGEDFNVSSFQFQKAGGRFAPQMRTSRLAAR